MMDGLTLVKLVNFSHKPFSVNLPQGPWRDLITLQALPAKIAL